VAAGLGRAGAARRAIAAVRHAARAGRRDTVLRIGTFVFRLQAPRPDFALTMTDQEREMMGRHAAYWQPYIDSGQMVVFGPVLDATGSWGLGVVEAQDEQALRTFAAGDPVVTSGTASIEMGKMLAGFLRPLEPPSR
jgi:uncharacterized protein